MTRLLALSTILLSLLFAGCSQDAMSPEEITQENPNLSSLGEWEGGTKNNYEVALVVDMDDYQDNVSAAWMGYLMARDLWISNNLQQASLEDFQVYTPRYGEELAGRRALVQLWQNFRANGAKPDEYLDKLAQIDKAGLMEAYVWRYHHQRNWGTEPGDLPWIRFDQWMTQRMPEFTPETKGAIKLLQPGATEEVARTAGLEATK